MISTGAPAQSPATRKGPSPGCATLPVTTGKAIAAYLKRERPKTNSRGCHHLPQAIYPRVPVLFAKRSPNAFARAGHLYILARTCCAAMANRLAGGSSLKEVADVLRHRSLNTTMIYAKLDSRRRLLSCPTLARERSMSAATAAKTCRYLVERRRLGFLDHSQTYCLA